MMSYSPQPEYFARTLKRRLQSLTPEPVNGEAHRSPDQLMNGDTHPRQRRSSSPDLDDCHEVVVVNSDIQGNKEYRIRQILERGLRTCDGYVVKMSPGFPLPGTTFPPTRIINEDYLRTKFQSESDFYPILKTARRADGLGPLHVKSPLAVNHNNNTLQKEEVLPAVDKEACDSDLFFDFDIGSPEQNTDSDEDHPEPIINVIPKELEDDMETPTMSNGHLEDDLNLVPNRHSPDSSTAYGSTSSGLFSDQETPSPSDAGDENNEQRLEEFVEGFSLNPEDWAKNQQNIFAKFEKSSSATPVQSSPASRSPPIPVPSNNNNNAEEEVDMGDEDVKVDDEPVEDESREDSASPSPDESSSMSDDSELKVTIGSQEKAVAHSKLQSLLAQLEKSQECPDSPSKTCGNFLRLKKEVKTSLSNSPANFSFLVGSVSNSATTSDEEPNKAPLRTDAPEMLEYDRLKGSASPKPEDRSTDVSTLDLIETQEEEKKKTYRKCSSLRSGKTPPCTPGRRKIVRFADVFGLDLADVKTFLDEIPRVPRSAFKDLKDAELSDIESDSGSELQFSVQPPTGPPTALPTTPSAPTIAPLFNQPSGSSAFFNTLRDRKVCLESAYMSDQKNIRGTVRVVNLDFNKRVVVRYTTDDWASTTDAEGAYMNGSCDGFSDKFAFNLDYTNIAGCIGKRLQFCIKFECASNEYWDNNNGKNYIFQCFGPSPLAAIHATSVASRKSYHLTTPVAAPPAGRGRHHNTNNFSNFSHSPAMNEEPWLRYL